METELLIDIIIFAIIRKLHKFGCTVSLKGIEYCPINRSRNCQLEKKNVLNNTHYKDQIY